jgi:hypothetical protein
MELVQFELFSTALRSPDQWSTIRGDRMTILYPGLHPSGLWGSDGVKTPEEKNSQSDISVASLDDMS